MRRSLLVVLLVVSAALTGCEEIVGTDGLPYEERLIVHGVIVADSLTRVMISRTVPLNSGADTNDAFLSDVTGHISDGTTSYPLRYLGYGSFYTAEGLRPRIGQEYHLTANWNGREARATTRMPAPITIDSAYVHVRPDSSSQAEVKVRAPELGSVQHNRSLIYFLDSSGDTVNALLHSGSGIQDRNDADSVGQLTFYGFRGISSAKTIEEMRIYSFDEPYLSYYESRFRDDIDFFTGQPGNINWNVTGDALGIFVGATITTVTVRY